jgi:hypothetical protein
MEALKKDWGNGTRDFAAKSQQSPIGPFNITWIGTRLTVDEAVRRNGLVVQANVKD